MLPSALWWHLRRQHAIREATGRPQPAPKRKRQTKRKGTGAAPSQEWLAHLQNVSACNARLTIRRLCTAF